jgi:16S rRNA (guanine527-N7)-methyltransferase
MFISASARAPSLVPVPEWFSALLPQELSQDQVAKLYAHYELLERWNQKMNLTTVKSGAEMVTRHYCESLFFGSHLPDEPTSLMDVGTGAGFPGVPIAILKPSCAVTLVESHQRKAVFLRESTRGLANVSVVAQRAQALTDKFEWVVSRAVDPLEVSALVPKLGMKIGLMVGEEDFIELEKLSHIAWQDPIRLPWGDRRICVYGNVPRGTSSSNVPRGT